VVGRLGHVPTIYFFYIYIYFIFLYRGEEKEEAEVDGSTVRRIRAD
jgi:hypothetical protein